MDTRIASVNGTELAYVRLGKGTPLLLVHGFPLEGSCWSAVAPLLAEHFDVIVPDLRGFGRSTTKAGEFTMADLAGDLAALLDHLGIDRAALAGHSMGGYVALAFAREFPQRLAGLALVSSQAAADSPERQAGRHATADAVAAQGVAVLAETMPAKLTAVPELQDCLREVILRQRPAGVIAALRAMAGREDGTDLLASLTCPLVLVHGDADALIPADRAHQALAAQPAARLTLLPGIGHMPANEAPEAVAAALASLPAAT